MAVVAFVLLLAVSGLVVGGLARLAVPGPDPMPWWQTIALGVAGSFLGGLVAAAVGLGGSADDAGDASGSFVASVAGATVLLILYRKLVQGRPLTGPGSRGR